LKPGREEALDLPTASRLREAGRDRPLFHHDERRQLVDPEVLDEVRTLLLLDAIEVERSVVPPALEHLREEPLGSATSTGTG
jgi:hypothetical protein